MDTPPVKVLYEDDLVLAIDKPSGMVVNRAVSAKGLTVQDWADQTQNFPLAQDSLHRNGIVHRLDKETSGVMLVAKTVESFEKLQQEFKERIVEKTYISLVHGVLNSESGVVAAPVGRLPWNRERFGILPGGRESETRYKVIKTYPSSNLQSLTSYSLVEWYPKTGRTHQIRVHAKYLHHPLVGDEFYAGRKTARNDRKWCPRLFLHAQSISFVHPLSGERIQVQSPLPEDLEEVLKKLNT